MEIKRIEGIVASEMPYGETSKILNIITKDYGVIGVIAKGAKRLKSNIRSVSQRFCYASFEVYYKEGKLSTLISADVINPLANIKKDIEKISYLNFITELTSGVLKQAESKEIYDLYVSSFLKINEGFDSMVITNILELKYLDYLGIAPVLDGCYLCGNKDVVTLSSYKGGFVCRKHLEDDYIVDIKTIKIIRMFKYVDISLITKIDIKDNVKNEINEFLDDYYDRYSGLYLKSKSFLKNIVKIK